MSIYYYLKKCPSRKKSSLILWREVKEAKITVRVEDDVPSKCKLHFPVKVGIIVLTLNE
jgi:hypothetical protein